MQCSRAPSLLDLVWTSVMPVHLSVQMLLHFHSIPRMVPWVFHVTTHPFPRENWAKETNISLNKIGWMCLYSCSGTVVCTILISVVGSPCVHCWVVALGNNTAMAIMHINACTWPAIVLDVCMNELWEALALCITQLGLRVFNSHNFKNCQPAACWEWLTVIGCYMCTCTYIHTQPEMPRCILIDLAVLGNNAGSPMVTSFWWPAYNLKPLQDHSK